MTYQQPAPAKPLHAPMKTTAGTSLPMLDLKGKPYLQVAHRIVWFREEHPNGTIETEPVTLENDKNRAIFRAHIKDENGRLLAQATGSETQGDFADFIEKAETKAIGRALAMCGYGTQFAPELDEGDRIVDSPMTPAKFAPRPAEPAKRTTAQQEFEKSLPQNGPHATAPAAPVPSATTPKVPVSRVGQAIQSAMNTPKA